MAQVLHDTETSMPLAELLPDSLSVRVFESIQAAITNKSLPPGVRVTEANLAAQLNVSKTPVREAFIKMRQIGLIEPDGRRSWRVVQMTRKRIDDACEVREALEVAAARGAAERGSPELRSKLGEAAEGSLAAARAGNKELFRSFDNQFHRAIAEATENERLISLIDDTLMLIATLRLRDLPHKQASIECAQAHVAIATTIASGSVDAAGEAMRGHLQQVKEFTFSDVE
jgi:DNA-binding GntR family transcriptional regulator